MSVTSNLNFTGRNMAFSHWYSCNLVTLNIMNLFLCLIDFRFSQLLTPWTSSWHFSFPSTAHCLSFFLTKFIFFKVDSNLTHLITIWLVARGTSQELQPSCLITIFINFVSAHLSLFWAWRGSKKMSPWRVFNASLIVKVNKTDYVSSSVLLLDVSSSVLLLEKKLLTLVTETHYSR